MLSSIVAALSAPAAPVRGGLLSTARSARASPLRALAFNPAPLMAKNAKSRGQAKRAQRVVRVQAAATSDADDRIKTEHFLNRAVAMCFSENSRVSCQGGPDGLAKGPTSNIFWASLGAFVGMTVLGLVDSMLAAPLGLPFMIGSWATLSVLLFGCPGVPVLNKWNIIMGHIGSAMITVVCLALMGPGMWTRSVAFALTVAYMLKCGCVHPPGGALVLIGVDGPKFAALGPLYILYPALFGAFFLLALASVIDYCKAKYVFNLSDIFGGGEAPKPKLA